MLPFAALAGLAGQAGGLASKAGAAQLASSLGGLSAGLGAAGAALGPVGIGLSLVTGFLNDRDADKARKAQQNAKVAMAQAQKLNQETNIAIQKTNIHREYNNAYTTLIFQEAAAHETTAGREGQNIVGGSNIAARENIRDKLDNLRKKRLDDVNTTINPQHQINATSVRTDQNATQKLFDKVTKLNLPVSDFPNSTAVAAQQKLLGGGDFVDFGKKKYIGT